MIRTLLVDDEKLARFELRRLLRSHPEIEIVGEAKDGDEALRLIKELAPDVLFLDIQMPGMTGFDLLEEIDGNLADVVFTTAYDQHAVKAFEVNALDYLLKPIAAQRLKATVTRLNEKQLTIQSPQLFVRDGERCWIVQLSDVFLLESEGNYTRLYFADERPLIRRSLNFIEHQFERMFFRANRRQLLNLASIKSVRPVGDGSLIATLHNGAEVELSRRRSEELRAKLKP